MTKVLNGAKHFGLSAIGQLMINVLGLIVLWIAVMAALKSNKITEEAVKPVAEFGESIGKLMKSIPKMIPIIPTPHGPMGLQGLSRMGENFASEIRNSAGNVGAELGTKWGQAAATAMGNKSNDPRVSELRNGLSRLD